MNPIHDGLLQGLITLLALLAFLGICFYAFSPSRRATFERAAQLPVDESEDGDGSASP